LNRSELIKMQFTFIKSRYNSQTINLPFKVFQPNTSNHRLTFGAYVCYLYCCLLQGVLLFIVTS
jgi:hypothetical protein